MGNDSSKQQQRYHHQSQIQQESQTEEIFITNPAAGSKSVSTPSPLPSLKKIDRFSGGCGIGSGVGAGSQAGGGSIALVKTAVISCSAKSNTPDNSATNNSNSGMSSTATASTRSLTTGKSSKSGKTNKSGRSGKGSSGSILSTKKTTFSSKSTSKSKKGTFANSNTNVNISISTKTRKKKKSNASSGGQSGKNNRSNNTNTHVTSNHVQAVLLRRRRMQQQHERQNRINTKSNRSHNHVKGMKTNFPEDTKPNVNVSTTTITDIPTKRNPSELREQSDQFSKAALDFIPRDNSEDEIRRNDHNTIEKGKENISLNNNDHGNDYSHDAYTEEREVQCQLNNEDLSQHFSIDGNISSTEANPNNNGPNSAMDTTSTDKDGSIPISSVNSFGSINTTTSKSIHTANSLSSIHTPQSPRPLSAEIVARKKAMKEDEVRHRIKRLGKSQKKKVKENEMRSRLGRLTKRKSPDERNLSAGEEVEEEEKREITKEIGDSSYNLKRIQNSLLEKEDVIEGQRQLIEDLSSKLETLSHNENQSLPNEVDVKNFGNSVAAKVLLQSPMSLSPSSVEKTLYSDFFENTVLSKDEDDVSSVSC